MSLPRIFARTAAGLLLTAAAVAGATAAQAAPQSCTTSQTLNSASSFCATGTGEQRVVVWAINQVTGAAAGSQQFTGAWVPAGATSSVSVTGVWVVPMWSLARTETRG
ncbi:MAG: hypothetical protein V7637_4740 [Mycobacteriales bacterium]